MIYLQRELMRKPLEIEQLYHACDASLFSFSSTQELEPLEQPIGQEKALEAVEFAAKIKQSGYNLFAMGPSGGGKHSTIMDFLEQKAKEEEAPKDWCYVNNFKDPRKPIAIDLPAGDAVRFKDEIYELIELLKVILPATFESNEYRNERESINQKYVDKQAAIFEFL